MNIDFKNFEYRIIDQYQLSPKEVHEEKVVSGRENIRYEFSFKENDDGFHIIASSEIYIPLDANGRFLMFKGNMTFLIPYEQSIEAFEDRLKVIDESVRAEFLFYHLSRQSTIVYAETHRLWGAGHNIDVPSIYRLFKGDLSA